MLIVLLCRFKIQIIYLFMDMRLVSDNNDLTWYVLLYYYNNTKKEGKIYMQSTSLIPFFKRLKIRIKLRWYCILKSL